MPRQPEALYDTLRTRQIPSLCAGPGGRLAARLPRIRSAQTSPSPAIRREWSGVGLLLSSKRRSPSKGRNHVKATSGVALSLVSLNVLEGLRALG
jgi:hypothetical protein